MKLVIAEKPSVAMNIASVLGANSKKNGYTEGNDYIVSWCVGHLVGYAFPEAYDDKYAEKWAYEHLPIIPGEWKTFVNANTLEQYQTLEKLMRDDRVTSVVCATDAGREGELIFRHVYNYAKCKKPIQRLWISSLEDEAIKEGFANLKPGRDFDSLYDAAVGRAKADWLIGMNCSRLFTVLYSAYPRLNVGRVQTPTLAMIVEREEQIRNFVKKPFYTTQITCDNGLIGSSERFDNNKEAKELAKACEGKQAEVTLVETEQKTVKPPLLYDLTSLQQDANRLFGFTAQETLDHVQSLYEKKLCTYPRTDSKYLSEDMEETANSVIQAIFEEENSVVVPKDIMLNPNIKRVMNSKKVTDHHAIIPTVRITSREKLHIGEEMILNLIMNRLVSAVAGNHLYSSTKAVLTCEGKEFTAYGKVITEMGWKEFESYFKKHIKSPDAEEEKTEDEEQTLPSLSKGMNFTVSKADVKEGSTQPPKHFTEATILAAMERAGASEMEEDVERKGLGTTATRAGIIESLLSNGYVERQKKNLISTDRGNKLIAVLPDTLKTPSLTAEWENKLAEVSKGEFVLDDFMSGIEEMVRTLVDTHKEAESGHENDFKAEAKPKETIGKCPQCGQPVYDGKYGAYCSAKCGMMFGYAFGVKLTTAQVGKLLAGKKILVKGCKGKENKIFDAYLTANGTKPYKEGYVFDFDLEYPQKK